MKIYLKNLFGCFVKNPFQPLALLLILICSTVVFCISLTVMNAVNDREVRKQNDLVGSADAVATVRNDAALPFFFTDALTLSVGESTDVYGYFEVPMKFNGGETANCFVIDLRDFLQINPSPLLSATGTQATERENAAIVSETYAANNHIALGDVLQTEFLGQTLQYKVIAVAQDDKGFFWNAEVIVDSKKLTRCVLVDHGLGFLSNHTICSTALIRIKDGYDRSAALEAVRDACEENKLSLTITQGTDWIKKNIFSIIIATMLVVLTFLTAIIISFSLFGVFFSERIRDAGLFKSIGFSDRRLALLLLAESVSYGLIAGGIGIALSPVLIGASATILNHNFPASLDPVVAVCSVLACVVCSALSVLYPIRKLSASPICALLSGETEEKSHRSFFLVPTSLLLIFGISLSFAFLPHSKYMIPAIADLCAVVLFLFSIIPYIFSWVSKLLKKVSEKATRLSFSFVAIQTMIKKQTLTGVLRTLIVGGLLLSVIAGIMFATEKQIEQVKELVGFDCMIQSVGSSEKICRELNASEEVSYAGRCYFYVSGKTYPNKNVIAVDGKLSDFFDMTGTGYVENGPLAGDEIVLTQAVAEIEGVRVGDKVSFIINNGEYEFTVKQIIQRGLPTLFVNASYVGLPYDKILVRANEPYKDTLYDHLQTAYGQRMCIILHKDYFLKTATAETTVKLGKYFSVLVAAFVLIGLINSLYDCVKKSKRDYEIFFKIGASKKDVAGYIGTTVLFCLLLSSALITVFYFLLAKLIYAAGLSLGVGLVLY